MIAKIEFKKPPGASVQEIATFIHDALSAWGGGFHPEDPLFHSLTLTGLVVHGKTFNVGADDTQEAQAAP